MTSLAVRPGPIGAGRGRLVARLRRAHLALFYRWRHGDWPALDTPVRFTEWVQWRKLHDRSPILARLTDKLHAKDVVEERLGPGLAVPTAWQGTALPIDPPAPFPFVLKSNHGCGQYRVVRDAADWRRARRLAPLWLRVGYGRLLGEGQYRAARHLLLVEPFLGDDGAVLPDDYKVYVFGGRAEIVQHHVGRGSDGHRWTQFDRDWHQVGGSPDGAPPPATLDAMLDAAERLAAGHDFLRVDFYEVGGRLWFGEFCLFPGSGLDPFTPATLDRSLGALWSAARGGQ